MGQASDEKPSIDWWDIVVRLLFPVIVGASITFGASILLQQHANTLQRTQLREASALEFQREALQLTGEIREALEKYFQMTRRMRQLLAQPENIRDLYDPDEVERIFNSYREVMNKWNRERIILRNIAWSIHGSSVANAIQNRNERNVGLDSCRVEIEGQANEAEDVHPDSCIVRQINLRDKFGSVFASAIDGDLEPYEELLATGFNGRLRLANATVSTYSDCVWLWLDADMNSQEPPTWSLGHPCQDLEVLEQLTSRYIDLVSLARERFADSMLN